MGEEKEVRKEDQDRINRFSRLHSREKLLEDDLKTKQVRSQNDLVKPKRRTDPSQQKDKEDLEEISSELELADEEDKVPCVFHKLRPGYYDD